MVIFAAHVARNDEKGTARHKGWLWVPRHDAEPTMMTAPRTSSEIPQPFSDKVGRCNYFESDKVVNGDWPPNRRRIEGGHDDIAGGRDDTESDGH
jgi:hypothetical protein